MSFMLAVRIHRWRLLALFLLSWPVLAGAAPERDIWILVDTEKLTLEVRDDDRTLLSFSGIAIGRGGTGQYKRRGDKRTPLGWFQVAWVNHKSRFRTFVGLDYPREEHVEKAFKAGVIDDTVRHRLLGALEQGRLPPQNSPLGGSIGIHGLGAGDLRLHRMSNWTEGCVALTNDQLDRVLRWVSVGTPVLIR